ncbi:MAG: FAS1-like dehydratase domain-containing protein [Kiloniellales bacterium]
MSQPRDPCAWIGRSESQEDILELARTWALQATLDDSGPGLRSGDPLPPLWHWVYFWQPAPTASLGPDGHAARGGFLPPIALPRRMWAGSRFRFEKPLLLGAKATRRSTVASVEEKDGRSGRLAFVTVRHEFSDEAGGRVLEEHDIVYRSAPVQGAPSIAPEPAPPEAYAAPWHRELVPDALLLFRYSALTFNGHRIHYDLAYVREVEGYSGLIVHGPLIATLMAELVRRERPRGVASRFAFRVRAPLFAGDRVVVAGAPDRAGAKLWMIGPGGRLVAEGEIAFA